MWARARETMCDMYDMMFHVSAAVQNLDRYREEFPSQKGIPS